jgi:hypothetical protein
VNHDKYSHYTEAPVGPLPVKILDKDGNLVRVVSAETLGKRPSPVPAQHAPIFHPREEYPEYSTRRKKERRG